MTSGLDSWHSYPKVWALGHAAIRELLLDPVLVEEKIDGSQFSFGRFVGDDGEHLRCRSKGCQLNVEAPERLFEKAVATARELFPILTPGWTYRCEYLAKPKHNTLAYDRIPARHLIVFDVNTGHETYLDAEAKAGEAARLGLESVPVIMAGPVADAETFLSLLDRESVLGGQKIEGIVAKNYGRFGLDGKALMGKFVSEAFKETHAGDWRERNPGRGDIIEVLVARYRTPARWAKAVQHLRDAEEIEGAPRDIGKLIPAARADIRAECEDEIKAALFAWAWPSIERGVTRGLPEWWKEQLLRNQFEDSHTA